MDRINTILIESATKEFEGLMKKYPDLYYSLVVGMDNVVRATDKIDLDCSAIRIHKDIYQLLNLDASKEEDLKVINKTIAMTGGMIRELECVLDRYRKLDAFIVKRYKVKVVEKGVTVLPDTLKH